MIQWGSRFLTDTESRYSLIELECLACLWTCRKCHTYSQNSHTSTWWWIIGRWYPIPILNSKRLSDIENPRLQRLREKLTPYSFTTSWQKGQKHCIPGALSRAPTSDPEPGDEVGETSDAVGTHGGDCGSGRDR